MTIEKISYCILLSKTFILRMKKSRLVNIFRTLTKKEIRDLRKWLHSPAHNQREDTVRLFEYLVREGNLQNEEMLDKSTIFPYVLPAEQGYDDAKMRQVMFFLLRSTEDFLVYEEFKSQSTEQNLLLTRALGKRKINSYFPKAVKNSLETLHKKKLRDKDFYRYNYEIKYENYEYQSKINRLGNFNLQEISDSFDIYYISLKLKQSCIMASHQKVFKTEYDIGLLEEILNYVQSQKLYEVPAIGMYYFGYKSIVGSDGDASFRSLKQILQENEVSFLKTELGEIYLIAINYCIGKMNAGETEFIREAFELYKRGFESKILLTDGGISLYAFVNVTSIARSIKEYTWAENFIENYNQYLAKGYRQTTVLYCLAQLEYDKGNFEKAEKLFIRVEHPDILLNLSAKTFLLKMYYEAEELSVLESLLGSMRTYLRRKNFVGYHKQNYKNIIKYTKKLVRVNPYSRADKTKLKNEVEQVSPLTERKWILAQLAKM